MKKPLSPSHSPKKTHSPGIRLCLILGIILMSVGVGLYALLYMGLDREFYYNEKSFGKEVYREIFSLNHSHREAEPILQLGEEAFSYKGTEKEAEERFGLLSRYSLTEEGQVTQTHTLDYINSHIEGDRGYVWVAYIQQIYDGEGNLLQGSGGEKARILSRWTVEKQKDTWVVTEIREAP